MKLVAGSYERFLWGWQLHPKHQELQPSFSYPAHLGPIKCIAAFGSVLASGGADDTIRIFDLSAQKDMGTLLQHSGAVSALCFYGSQSSPLPFPNNLLSASDDGTICIWDTDSWLHYKTMKGHKRGVNDLSIHPSGRLSLSVGRDSHLNMYNLLKGRCTFTSKLPSEASLIKFSPREGASYSLATENVLTIHNAEDGRTLHTFTHDKRVLCVAQKEDDVLFTGGEDCTLSAWDTNSGKLAFSISNAHANRIRGLGILGLSQTGEDEPYLVASASSDGFVRVWDTRIVRMLDCGTQPTALMEAETKARLTCLVACSLKSGRKKALKRNNKSLESAATSTSPRQEDGRTPEVAKGLV